jgi:hypothetical protein
MGTSESTWSSSTYTSTFGASGDMWATRTDPVSTIPPPSPASTASVRSKGASASSSSGVRKPPAKPV